jgi:hypothetical protein
MRLLAPIRDLGPVIDTFAMVPPAALGDLFRGNHHIPPSA